MFFFSSFLEMRLLMNSEYFFKEKNSQLFQFLHRQTHNSQLFW